MPDLDYTLLHNCCKNVAIAASQKSLRPFEPKYEVSDSPDLRLVVQKSVFTDLSKRVSQIAKFYVTFLRQNTKYDIIPDIEI